MKNKLAQEDCLSYLRDLDDNSINCIVTSPPYNKAGITGKGKSKIGNQIWSKFNIDYESYGDNMPEQEYQAWMIELLNEMTRVITSDGSIFFNHKPRRFKNRVYLPTEFIHQSQANLYQLIIWDRRNSPNIRGDILVPCTEHVYWLCKEKPKSFRKNINQNYRGEVWTIPAKKQEGHPAPFPEQLVENCILLATESGDLVCDPFMGGGTTAVVSERLNRKWCGSELDPHYVKITMKRLKESSNEI
tara:strand:- start:2061 stop:2795 length:735 start_codon:yes stop_codon:yes gene_type:complete